MTDRTSSERIKHALQQGRRIAPSDPDPWHGTPAKGSIWTEQQLATAERIGRDLDKLKRCQVPLQITDRVNWMMPAKVRHLLCPQLAATRDGARAKIIAPAGDIVWVKAR